MGLDTEERGTVVLRGKINNKKINPSDWKGPQEGPSGVQPPAQSKLSIELGPGC